ncbi:hypothetical protein AALP_AA3G231500 [Arabis alpina]|uniref:Uncharacterized protein n=1 Tax=Arabis alpina TaxID=50452 RepID=A0A087HB38_ARAAL|nr:hypothetical protein AALP_AA3G231500 [Arabis alpina]
MAAMNTTDFQNCFIFILICFFSLLCYSLYFKKPKDSRACDLPPSPPSLPIIGHLHLLLSPLTHKSLQKLSSKYGTFLHIRIFNTPVILVSSASVAHEIFKAQDVNISSRGAPAIDESLVFGSSGIVTAPYGDYWKFIKKLMVTKLFRPQALEQSRGVRAEELQRFYGSILDKARKNENIDIGKEAMMLMNNNLCRMIMGRCLSKENGEAERIRGLVDESKALTKKIFLAAILRRPLEKLRIPLFKRDIMGVSNRFSELLERILVEHKDNPDEEHQRTDMMDVLLAAYGDENAEFKITMNHVKSFFVEFFIGGSDTSMQTIQWTMAEIINNSSVLERLRDEIDSFVGKTRLIQETDISNLPYLQAVVKEGLRLHPPSPLVVRMFQKSCEIKGFYIPEKTTLVINTYALMRDPDSWEDPNEFKPERFIDSSRSGQEDERKQALKYLPFGGGRRGCPGVNLANIFVGTTIGVMVQCFDWKIEGDKEPDQIFVLGTDTSAQTTQWTMAEIINNPNILKRLKEEIDSVVGKTRLIQETDLPNGSTKEGLRLHPPGPLLTRTFEESCEIKGFYIPKKSTLHVNVYAVMRDPNSWENPDEFKPERFLTSSRSEKEDEIREQALKIKGEKVNMEEAPAGMILAMAHPLKCTPIVRIDPSTLSFAVN